MVERQQPLLSATVVDLDGTLLRCNSLVRFAKYVLAESLRRRRFGAALRVVGWIALRQTRAVSHRRMKFHVLRAANFLRAADIDRFADMAPQWARIEVVDQMQDQLTLLATAAPHLYADAIARRFGICHVVATRMTDGLDDFVECRGEEKLRRVQSYLADHSAELTTVITDHADDLPLLRANPTGRNILVGSLSKSK